MIIIYNKTAFLFHSRIAASAFHPAAVHSMVSARLPTAVPPHLSRPGSRHLKSKPGSYAFIDPLFNVEPDDIETPLVPMTEEEFYRAKIKMKDG